MEEIKESSPDNGGGDDLHGNPNQPPLPSTYKGKSCKGCLYFTSVHKSNGRSPTCVGITRTLPHVPLHIVGESEMEATKDGRSLLNFKYACLGYSVFVDSKENSSDNGEKPTELPFCAGIELLVDRRASTATQTPAPLYNKEVPEDGVVRTQPRPNKPAKATGDEFFTRFKRSARLVASGVNRNLNRVGNYVKDIFDGMMYPYRRPPK